MCCAGCTAGHRSDPCSVTTSPPQPTNTIKPKTQTQVEKRTAALQRVFRDADVAGELFDVHLQYQHTILLGAFFGWGWGWGIVYAYARNGGGWIDPALWIESVPQPPHPNTQVT